MAVSKTLIVIIVLFTVTLAGCAAPPVEKAVLPRASEELTGAVPTPLVEIVPDGEFALEASPLRKEINGIAVDMFGYNGRVPGPVLKVKQNSTIVVTFKNVLEVPTTVHWHGVRVENKYDGVPNITQQPVLPGETFEYILTFPDDGVYWYHSHVRGDMQLEMGLYGNIIVAPAKEGDYNPVDKEEILLLDDIRLSEGQIEEFSLNETNYALMGRFGNQMLVNGMTTYSLELEVGQIVRFYLTDAANTRTFNFSIENTRLKVVGSDSGLYENEFWADSVVLAPGERAIIEVLFEQPGDYRIIHSNPHKSYDLGVITVRGPQRSRDAFKTLREHSFTSKSIDPLRTYFDAPPDLEIDLTMEMSQMMMDMMKDMMGMNDDDMTMDQDMMSDDGMKMEMKSEMNMAKEGIEWEDEMPKMNALATNKNTKWILQDKKTGKNNMDIQYQTRVGDVKKIRLFNDPKSKHPMHHPIHLHGQRFLVLSVNGKENTNLVWKDVVLVPKGATVDILVDFTNPGDWLLHCHILEHAEAGMKSVIKVEA